LWRKTEGRRIPPRDARPSVQLLQSMEGVRWCSNTVVLIKPRSRKQTRACDLVVRVCAGVALCMVVRSGVHTCGGRRNLHAGCKDICAAATKAWRRSDGVKMVFKHCGIIKPRSRKQTRVPHAHFFKQAPVRSQTEVPPPVSLFVTRHFKSWSRARSRSRAGQEPGQRQDHCLHHRSATNRHPSPAPSQADVDVVR
jgi:hypothetical protein